MSLQSCPVVGTRLDTTGSWGSVARVFFPIPSHEPCDLASLVAVTRSVASERARRIRWVRSLLRQDHVVHLSDEQPVGLAVVQASGFEAGLACRLDRSFCNVGSPWYRMAQGNQTLPVDLQAVGFREDDLSPIHQSQVLRELNKERDL